MAGAIYWVRQLFHRLRKPVLTIQNVAELKYSHLKILAFNQYYDLSKQLKSYEESKFQQWMDKAQMIVINTMRRNILMMMRSDPDKGCKENERNMHLHLPHSRHRVSHYCFRSATLPDHRETGDEEHPIGQSEGEEQGVPFARLDPPGIGSKGRLRDVEAEHR